jgi:hypothetical protein
MSGISEKGRQRYGLCLGLLLLADLGGGAAVVVARASDRPAPPPAAVTRTASAVHPVVDDPAAGVAGAPAAATAGPSDCGQGSATARAVLDRTDSGYVLKVTVANDSNRTVELDGLVVQATYADGVRTLTAASAAGHRISSGVAETDFALPGSASATRPVSFGVADFAFHTAGRPDCAAR